MDRMPQKVFVQTEGDITYLRKMLHEIKRIENETIHEAASSHGTGRKDPTANTAIVLACNRRLNYVKKVTAAVLGVFESLSEPKREMVRLYYWQQSKPRWEELAARLKVKRYVVVRWRNEFVFEVADRLGRN